MFLSHSVMFLSVGELTESVFIFLLSARRHFLTAAQSIGRFSPTMSRHPAAAAAAAAAAADKDLQRQTV